MAATTPKKQRPTRKKNFSPEARQKLSDLAKQRHAEGKLGGSQYGKLGGRGNTREKRLAQQSVAQAAAEASQDIIQVFKDAIDPDRPMNQRLKGAELWLNVERENAKLSLAEAKAEGEQLDRTQLLNLLAERLTSGPTSSFIKARLEDPNVVEGRVVGDDS